MGLKTTKEKEDWLISKGWKQWGPDYWIHPVIMSGANWDWCGVSLDGAINVQKKQEEIPLETVWEINKK